MSASIKPWSTHRQILWLMGVLGLVLMWFGLFAVFMLQGGFGPGKQTSPPGIVALLGVIVQSFSCIYYVVVASSVLTRRLLGIGFALHLLALVFYAATGAFFAIPLALIWAVAWIVYARSQNND